MIGVLLRILTKRAFLSIRHSLHMLEFGVLSDPEHESSGCI